MQTNPAQRSASPLREELPRILVLLGIAFMVLGVLATIGLVAGDSSCNAATNLSDAGGVPAPGFCGHVAGFEAVSFSVLVLGALLVAFGSMVLPTLRERDARRAIAPDHAGSPLPPDEPTPQ